MARKYGHVIVVGVDGAGAFIEKAVTPCFDRIFENGSVTYRALSSNPTISAECWGSMLIGTSPVVHGLTNEIVEAAAYPIDSDFPSVYARIRKEYPDAELGAYCCWSSIISGIIGNYYGVTSRSDWDDTLADEAAEYIRASKPDFLFIHFDSVDGAGHGHGYGSKAHLDRIGVVDGLIGKVWDAVGEAGIADDTLFIVTVDHGGAYRGEDRAADHGGWTDAEKYVTFAAAGKTVKKGSPEKVNIRDLAAIVLYALGIDAPDFAIGGWTSQLPVGLFDDPAIDSYRDISDEEDAAPRISRIQHTSEKTDC